jgi:predicted kinase
MELVLVRGLPGSGKSHYAINTFLDHIIIEPDHIVTAVTGEYLYRSDIWEGALDMVYKLVDVALSQNKDVVVADVFCRVKEVDQYRDLAEFYGCQFNVVCVFGDRGNIHGVPYTVYKRMLNDFEYYPGQTQINNGGE